MARARVERVGGPVGAGAAPATDFNGLQAATFVAGVDAFIDAHAADRTEGVVAGRWT